MENLIQTILPEPELQFQAVNQIDSSQIEIVETNKNLIKKRKQKTTTKTKGNFRIAAKKLFLTYSQVPEELDVHQVYLQLQNKLSIQNYVIAREQHKDGGFHYHALIVLNKKCNITSSKTLDLTFQEKTFHGNYAPVKCIKQSILYVCKDKNYITNFKNIKDGRILSIPEEIINIYEEKGEREAMLHYFKAYPEHAFGSKGVVNAQRFFKTIKRLSKVVPSVPESPFTLDDFQVPPAITDWIEKGFQPTLLLFGPEGCGKTALVKTIAKQHGLKMLTITNIDGLRDLTDEYDLLFMDDIAGLDKVHPQKLLALLETNDARNIRVIYENAIKPPNIKQIIALNENAIAPLKSILMETQMVRRCRIVHINNPIIVNIKVENNTYNIFNQHADIYYNHKVMKENEAILKRIPDLHHQHQFL